MMIPGPGSGSLERPQLCRGTGSLGAAQQVDSKTNALLTAARALNPPGRQADVSPNRMDSELKSPFPAPPPAPGEG